MIYAADAIDTRVDGARIVVVACDDQLAWNAHTIRACVIECAFVTIRALALVIGMHAADQRVTGVICAPIGIVAVTLLASDADTSKTEIIDSTEVAIIAGEVVIRGPIRLAYGRYATHTRSI